MFELLCWNINGNCNVDAEIDRGGYQSKKQQERNTSLRFSLLFLLGQPLLCTFIVIFFYLCAANDSSKRKHCYGYMYLQLTAFTHVQSTISQSRDFNLCVQCPLKIP